MNGKFFISVLLGLLAVAAFAEDPKERVYQTPALSPRHADKPRITGWASTRVREKLNRGLVAVAAGEGRVYLSWRLLDTDDPEIAFNVFRSAGSTPVQLNKTPITATTDFTDTAAPRSGKATYWVQTVDKNKMAEAAVSEKVTCDPNAAPGPCLTISIQDNARAGKLAVADLNGDGVYDFVIRQPDRSIDPGVRPDTRGTTYKIEAYLADGTFLWRKDLGLGIEPGIWYSPYVVYDFDGDGCAEVALKTAPTNVREPDGRVRTGAEWCSILDGATGKELARVNWPERSDRYGDYNRQNRNQIGVAFLDGKTPCLLIARGTYKFMVLDAYQYHDKTLKQLWHWEGDDETPIIRSQGAHFMHSADVDSDGRDEVILGSVVIDDNGVCLWSAGLGHPDEVYVTDIDPARPGMEILYVIEPHHDDGMGICMVEARTGKTIWSVGRKTYHVEDAMAADIDPSLPGLECWALESSKGDPNGRDSDGRPPRYLFSADGKLQAAKSAVPHGNGWVFWDADLLREMVNFTGGWFTAPSASVAKYGGPTLTPNIPGRVIMTADILGDWREEIITAQSGKLCVYTTTIPAADRRVCLMQDPLYRADVAHLSMGYPQSPMTDYYIGTPVTESAAAKPVISVVVSQNAAPAPDTPDPDHND